MAGITGNIRTVRQLLRDDYSVGDFQRGFTWEHEHVVALLRDLARAFERRRDAAVSGEYYLGAIVTHNRYGVHTIIDGQQRLTTLLLILIWIRGELIEQRDRREAQIAQLILHAAGGREAFAIDVKERHRVMRTLYDDPVNYARTSRDTDTERNLVDRFETIAENFPDELRHEALKGFVDWLLDKVVVAKIECEKEADSYIIFETTNDRGQKLGSAQLLKNFLQSSIIDPERRDQALARWQKTMAELQGYSAGGDLEFIHLWLQSRHAELPTPPSRQSDLGRVQQDMFAWIKANAPRMRLDEPEVAFRFMYDEFLTVADAYRRLRAAEGFPMRGFDSLFFLANLKIGWMWLARVVALAGADPSIRIEDQLSKMRAGATFVELVVARLAWQAGASTSYQRYRPYLEQGAAIVRDGQPQDCVRKLTALVEDFPLRFTAGEDIGLPRGAGSRARSTVHTLLARMCACFDEAFGDTGAYQRYEIRSPAARGFTIEHVLANDDRGALERSSVHERRRNRMGALLLLRRRDNEMLADTDFAARRAAYRELTRLARTFHPDFYIDDARRVLDSLELPFRPCERFGPTEIEERSIAMARLAELTWHPRRIAFAARHEAPEDSRVYGLEARALVA